MSLPRSPAAPSLPCAGLLRDGTPCLARGNHPATVDGEEKLLCSWHARVWDEHHVLKPPPRKRKQVVTVDSEEVVEPEPALLPLTPLDPEGGEADLPDTNGSAPRTLRERVEDTTEALYEDIEGGLRAALTNATKTRKTRCPGCQEVFEVKLPDHGASISAAKALLDLVVSRPRAESEPDPAEIEGEGFDFGSLSTAQLRRALSLTEEAVIERLEEETLAERVERVVDVADRFLADTRDVSPSEVTEAKAMLAAMRHYDQALAPIRRLRIDWREPLELVSEIPRAPRSMDEGV